LALALFVVGGVGSSPMSPGGDSGPSTTWTLTGTVTSSAGGSIAGASVAILDGPSANAQTTTDASGRYTRTKLRHGGFSVRASANGDIAITRGVTLTSNTTADFQLPHNAVAEL
jgi:hypothetical protein